MCIGFMLKNKAAPLTIATEVFFTQANYIYILKFSKIVHFHIHKHTNTHTHTQTCKWLKSFDTSQWKNIWLLERFCW